MVDCVAVVLGRPWPMDAGRHTLKGDSGRATDPFGGYRSCAAGRAQTSAGVAESII
jgi:hypothetical protein